jgi:hypothetical protein
VKDEFHNVPLRDRKFVYSMPLLEIFHMTRLVIILACRNVPPFRLRHLARNVGEIFHMRLLRGSGQLHNECH